MIIDIEIYIPILYIFLLWYKAYNGEECEFDFN